MIDGVDARGLYESLMEHEGGQPFRAVAVPWLASAQGAYRNRLAAAGGFTSRWWTDRGSTPSGQDLNWELYALSRVSDALLLAHQPPPAGGDDREPWISVPLSDWLELFTGLGMTPFDLPGGGGAPGFDPFRHEIVEVEQAADPDAPIEVTAVRRPGLMLGELLFARAGVRVRAGTRHAQRGVADRFPLYWTHRRRSRPANDLSRGWGSNSQWRTGFRLDYRTPDGDRLNVEGDRPIDGDPALDPEHPMNLGRQDRLLTPAERRELLRHRTLLRLPEAVASIAEPGEWEQEFWPFDWRLPDVEELRR